MVDVEAERVVATGVAGVLDRLSVQVNLTAPVDRPEVQERAMVLRLLVLIEGELAAIPEGLIGSHCLADAAEGRFDRKWHENLPIPFLGDARLAISDRIVPQPVQALPVVPLKLGRGYPAEPCPG